jgi:hypothetical protein
VGGAGDDDGAGVDATELAGGIKSSMRTHSAFASSFA